MQRSCSTTGPQVILLLFLGSYVWARQLSDNYEMARLLYSYPSYYKRLPSYDFGLGKRSSVDDASNEDISELMDRDQANIPYPFLGPGKRNRAYGFGLGKRQERRSKIYSFGLGKRSHDMLNEDYDGSQPTAERRASSQRQFAFGLGKRDVKSSGGTAE